MKKVSFIFTVIALMFTMVTVNAQPPVSITQKKTTTSKPKVKTPVITKSTNNIVGNCGNCTPQPQPVIYQPQPQVVYQMDTTICITKQYVREVGGNIYTMKVNVYPSAGWRNLLEITTQIGGPNNVYGYERENVDYVPLAPYVKNIKITVDEKEDKVIFEYVYDGELIPIEIK